MRFSVEPEPFRRLEWPREVDMVGGKAWKVPMKEGQAREGKESQGRLSRAHKPGVRPHTRLFRAQASFTFTKPKISRACVGQSGAKQGMHVYRA
jgi:hypothetical protein